METRLITPADAFSLAALHRASFAEKAWNQNQFTGNLQLATSQGWMIDSAGAPQGFILCQFSDDEAEILTFCIHPAMRRRGLARALLTIALAAAQEKGCGRLFLDVAADNAAALALYDTTGFRPVGRRKNYYRHTKGAIDSLLMERSLK